MDNMCVKSPEIEFHIIFLKSIIPLTFKQQVIAYMTDQTIVRMY